MGAHFSSDDKNWLLGMLPRQRILTEREDALVSVTFDTETDVDVQRIQMHIEEIRMLKRICVFKMLMFVPEYLLLCIMFDKKRRSNRVVAHSLFYRFTTNKINLETFKKELSELTKAYGVF